MGTRSGSTNCRRTTGRPLAAVRAGEARVDWAIMAEDLMEEAAPATAGAGVMGVAVVLVGTEAISAGRGRTPSQAAAVAGAAVLVVEGSWAADDLLEVTRPGEPSRNASA